MIRVKKVFLVILFLATQYFIETLPIAIHTGGNTGNGGNVSGGGGNVTPPPTPTPGGGTGSGGSVGPQSTRLSPLSTQVYTNLQSTDPVIATSSAFMRHTQPGMTTAQYGGSSSSQMTAGAVQVTPLTKHSLPVANSLTSQSASLSVTQKKNVVTMNQGLFSSNSSLAPLYQALMTSLQGNASFVPIFTRFHIVALHQLYQHLMGIYVALTMTHIDDLQTYLTMESIYALNKKTLIVQHFIELIEAQLNQALQALMPGMPQQYATIAGPAALNNDSQSKLEILLVDMEDVACASINIAPISIPEWQEVLAALTSSANIQYLSSLYQPTLQSIITKLNTYIATNSSLPSGTTPPTFLSQLTCATTPVTSATPSSELSERDVLVDALELLTRNFAFNQQLTDLSYLVGAVAATPVPSAPLTYSQSALLTSVVSTLAFSGELEAIMNALLRIQAQLQSSSPQSLASADQSTLLGIIAFSLLHFEQQSVNAAAYLSGALVSLIQSQIQTLSPAQVTEFAALNQLTEFQQAYLQTLAVSLLADTNQLGNLVQSDRIVLANGCIWLAANPPTVLPPLSAVTLQLLGLTATPPTLDTATLGALGSALLQNPIPESALTNAQEIVYQQALLIFQSYVVVPYSIAQATADMNTLYSTSAQQAELNSLTAVLDQGVGGVAALQTLTVDQQIMALTVFQALGKAYQSSMLMHQSQALSISNLLQSQTNAVTLVYNALSYDQYNELASIYTAMAPSTNPASAGNSITALSSSQQAALLSLLTLFKAPVGVTPSEPTLPTLTNDSLPVTTSALPVGILDLLVTQSFSSPALQQLANAAGKQTTSNYSNAQLANLYTAVQGLNFALSSLAPADIAYLSSQLTTYQALLNQYPPDNSTPSSAQAVASAPASQQQSLSDLAGIAAMVLLYNNLDLNQQTYFATMGAYLSFMNNYTNTLNTNLVSAELQSSSTATTGFTEFAQIAQSIQTSLQNTPLGTLNPTLFFYDAKTMTGINIIPVLAGMVDGTSSAPYPTFGMNIATGSLVTAANTTSNTASNAQQIVQSNQIYMMTSPTTQVPISVPSCIVNVPGNAPFSPRFFFKDVNGNVYCNNNTVNNVTSNLAFTQTTTPFCGQPTMTNSTLSWIQKVTVPATSTATSQFLYLPSRQTQGQEGFYMNIPITSSDPNKTSASGVLVRLYEQPIYAQPAWLNSVTGIMTMLRGCLGDFSSILTLSDTIFDPCLELMIKRSLAYAQNIPTTISALAYSSTDPNVSILEAACNTCLAQAYGNTISGEQSIQTVGALS